MEANIIKITVLLVLTSACTSAPPSESAIQTVIAQTQTAPSAAEPRGVGATPVRTTTGSSATTEASTASLPATSALSASTAVWTPTPISTPLPSALPPLDRKDASSVLQWIQYALKERDMTVFETLTAEDGVTYANYLEGGQFKTKQEFLTDLKLRLMRSPQCDGYIDYSNYYHPYLDIWTSSWSPAWEMSELCYKDCRTLSPPWTSTTASLQLEEREKGWTLFALWLNDLSVWQTDIDVYNVQVRSCDQPLSSASGESPQVSSSTTTSCPRALPAQLKVGGYAYVSTDPPLSNRVRSGPGTQYAVIGNIQSGKAIEILAGPECADNWAWWKVRVLDTGLIGWTVEGNNEGYWLVPCSSRDNCGVP